MDGRYPNGHFYRPVTTLSFALDHAVWGLDPSGYHLTDLAAAARLRDLVAALGRRLLGPGVGPLAAALLFALHPLQIEALPVAARRADNLALLFTDRCSRLPQPARRSWPCLRSRAALAVGSKEIRRAVVPLLLALGFAEAGPARGRARLGAAVRTAALPALAALLVLLGRTAVLGGIGGHPGSSLLAGVRRGLAIVPHYTFLLLMPQPLVATPARVGPRRRRGGRARSGARVLARGRPRAACCSSAASGCSRASGSRASPARSPPGTRSRSCRPSRCWSAPWRRRAARCAAQRRRAAAALGAVLTVPAARPGAALHAARARLPRVAAGEPAIPGIPGARAGGRAGTPRPETCAACPASRSGSPPRWIAWACAARWDSPSTASKPGPSWLPGPPIVVTGLDGAPPSPPRPDAIRIETTPDLEAGQLP